ncbi:MAG: protocatechuate 3,4-dioxygenase [Betaproteobacteria bacterium]
MLIVDPKNARACGTRLPTCPEHKRSRRDALRAMLGFGAAMLATGLSSARAAEAMRGFTAIEHLGPFYPVTKPEDRDDDLTLVKGQPARAEGEVLYVSGRVLNMRGEPVRGAKLEVWQANAKGRYINAADRNPAPLDPNFQGYTRLVTNAEGRYAFKTIKPGAYPTPKPGWVRPPHIHFDITGNVSRLTTALYFDGEPYNDGDLVLQTSWARETQIVKLGGARSTQEPQALTAEWDIVLIGG